jgi:hypothetical protein
MKTTNKTKLVPTKLPTRYFFVFGVVQILTGLVSVLSLGFLRVSWPLDFARWYNRRLFKALKKDSA